MCACHITNKMSLKTLFKANIQQMLQTQSFVTKRLFATVSEDDMLASAEEKPVYERSEEISKEIELKRNKSRLAPQHRNIMLGEKPYEEPMAWYHERIKYKRRTLGRYGMESLDVPAGIAWPTPEEVEDAKEYERVAFPLSLQERWANIKEQRKLKEEAIMKRQQEISIKMAKMNDWILEVQTKVEKKKAEVLKAQERRNKLIEEVKRLFDYNISQHDEKFKEMLAKKEKEDKKKAKEAKKAAKAEKLANKLSLNKNPRSSETNKDSTIDKENTVGRTEESSETKTPNT